MEFYLLQIFLLLALVAAEPKHRHHHHHRHRNHHHRLNSNGDGDGNGRVATSAEERAFLDALGLKSVPKRRRRPAEVPDFLREQYRRQTGLEVDTTNFDLPGR